MTSTSQNVWATSVDYTFYDADALARVDIEWHPDDEYRLGFGGWTAKWFTRDEAQLVMSDKYRTLSVANSVDWLDPASPYRYGKRLGHG